MKSILTAFLLLYSINIFSQIQYCYRDNDGDGYGDPNVKVVTTIFGCPSGYIGDNTDCDDNDYTINPGTIWYKDYDNDGYTDGTTLAQCTQPPGYRRNVNSGIDCNDNDPLEFPGQLWFPDPDHDFYTDTDPFNSNNTMIISCSRPEGYITNTEIIGAWPNNIDCNQNDPIEHPDQIWYPDADADGYPADLNALVQCSRPPGYSAAEELISGNEIDCNDNDPAEHPGQEWYVDNDNDGYPASTPPVISCTAVAGLKASSALISLNTDCDDNDPTTNPATIWYKDADDDGYSDGSTLVQCTQPAGYKRTVGFGTDCDDNNPLYYPDQAWYRDNDGDGHGETSGGFGLGIVQCDRPAGYYAESELVAIDDCNDNDNAIYPGAEELCDDKDNDCNGVVDDNEKQYDYDGDGDGYGNPAIFMLACTMPSGYVLHEPSETAWDCDDNNAYINPLTQWYKDADNDGFSEAGLTGLPPIGCVRPVGYKYAQELTSIGTDCDDNNAYIHPLTEWYKDADNDGFSEAGLTGLPPIGCVRPAGYKYAEELTSIGTDCNDNNAYIHPLTIWYRDGDNDGYGDANFIGINPFGCIRPAGYKYAEELIETFTDCNDNNAQINPATTWYKDADNDGFTDGTTLTQCTRPAGYRLDTELTGTSGDCDDNDASLNPLTTWYRDADDDGYSDGFTVIQCAGPAGYKLSSALTALSGDCDDNNFAVNPGTPEICSNKIDDNCNGEMDEGVCEECQTGTDLNTTNITSSAARLNWSAVVTPHEWYIRYKQTGPGSHWMTFNLEGNMNYLDLTDLNPAQNYNWQIRADCGKNWTDYSDAAMFTTLSEENSSVYGNVNRGSDTREKVVGLDVRVMPNPSNSRFLISVNSEDLQDPVKVSVTDLLGRLIETRTVYAGEVISIGERYSSGTYSVRFIQGKTIRQLKLVKMR